MAYHRARRANRASHPPPLTLKARFPSERCSPRMRLGVLLVAGWGSVLRCLEGVRDDEPDQGFASAGETIRLEKQGNGVLQGMAPWSRAIRSK